MQEENKQQDFSSRAGTYMIAVAWVIFFAILYFIFEDQFSQRNNPNQDITTSLYGQQKEITLDRNAYGHYVSSGTINNHDVTFLLDTGATDIAIPKSIAEKISLPIGRKVYIKTANGNTVAYRTKLDSVAIGEIRLHDLNATILTNIDGEEILLGMNFLKHLEITQKGKTLTIRQ